MFALRSPSFSCRYNSRARRRRRVAGTWRKYVVIALAATALLSQFKLANAGDALFGSVTAVRRADLVVFKAQTREYNIRVISVEPPPQKSLADSAAQFVRRLTVGKDAQARVERRNANGELVSRLLVKIDSTQIVDIGIELVRSGLARRQSDQAYKYGELVAAENEARRTRRGMWATTVR